MDGGFPTAPRSLSDLESEITELTGHLNAATHRWLMLIAEFDTRKGWVGAGTQSCAHWPEDPLLDLYALATASHFVQGEARSTAVYCMYTREE